MNAERILVAGIGNIFMGDDAFGVAVIRALAGTSRPADVVLMDAGIRGIDLTYALMDGYAAAILIDAAPRGRAPGTLYVLAPDPDPPPGGAALFDAHALDPVRVFDLVASLGGKLDAVRVVGCEPETLGTPDDPVFELSPAVARAVPVAVELVLTLVAELRSNRVATEAVSCTS